MKKLLVMILLGVVLICGCSSSNNFGTSGTPVSQADIELEKAEKVLPYNQPNRDLVLEEVRNGNVKARDIEMYFFMDQRFQYYEQKDGEYIIEKHDPLVIGEAAKKFGLTTEQVNDIHWTVAKLMAGVKPKEPVKLDSSAIPVDISIDKVTVTDRNELLVTVTNRTKGLTTLPTMNMSFDLFKNGKKVGYQVVWAENVGNGTYNFTSPDIEEKFDAVECTVYINIDNMKNANLRSLVQEANDRGETVIPVYKLKMTKVK